MMIRCSFGKTLLISSLCWLAATQCADQQPAPIKPAGFYKALEALIRKHYVINPEGQSEALPASLAPQYQAALRTVHREVLQTHPDYYKKELIRKLQSKPDQLQIQRSILAFLRALPYGSNTAAFPAMINPQERQYGIGVILKQNEAGFQIADVLEGSGAFRANLQPGSVILAVDGTPVPDWHLQSLVDHIKGPLYTTVTLNLKRDVTSSQVTIERGQFDYRPLQSSRWREHPGRTVLYLMPRSINKEVIARIQGLLQEESSTAGVVLDLRKLYDGQLKDCVAAAALFRRQSAIFIEQNRTGDDQEWTLQAQSAFGGFVYVVYDRDSSALAHFWTWLLAGERQVTLLGPILKQIQAFTHETYPLPNQVQLTLTTGMILDARRQPVFDQGLRPDSNMQPGYPPNPPLEAPDPTDPAQMWLAQKLRLSPN
ncbi:MAG: PDZ domain-containing protein [Leptospiraceae bacterium]|nr:PDZ domain-containing protein [Leptospiraceae bacterium]